MVAGAEDYYLDFLAQRIITPVRPAGDGEIGTWSGILGLSRPRRNAKTQIDRAGGP
jgi:hypothetical protein